MAQANKCSLDKCKSFSIHSPKQKTFAMVVLGLSFAAWCVQLGGVAGLQAACKSDLHLENNEVDNVRALLLQTQAVLATINPAQPVPGVTVLKALAPLAKAVSQVTYRTSAVFTLTPDHECREHFRYQWLNVGLQLLVLALAFYSLFSGFLHHARVAVCSLLVVSSILAIENAHTFFHVRQYAPDLTLQRGKVFFAGCVATCVANLVLLFLLGVHDEQAEHPAMWSSSETAGKQVDNRGSMDMESGSSDSNSNAST